MLTLLSELGPIHIVEDVKELPLPPPGTKELYLDVETNADDSRRYGNRPYSGDRIAGIACSFDTAPDAFYVPLGHSQYGKRNWNLSLESVCRWLLALGEIPDWINHNCKFDAHFIYCEGKRAGFDLTWTGRLIDTLSMAKMHDSDRLQGYGLKDLCREWLHLDMAEEKEIEAYLKGAATKSYGAVPVDIMARYAGMDVLGNRALYKRLCELLPREVAALFFGTEVPLTTVLWDMERLGVRVDPTLLKIEGVKCLRTMLETSQRLAELTGEEYTDSNKHLYKIIVEQLDLPILTFTDKQAASFDSDTLELYSLHPKVIQNPEVAEIISLITLHRAEKHFKGTFVDAYLELMDDSCLLHSDYNQIVRTGRMSAKRPGAQQLSKRAKALIQPHHPEWAFLSADASQIEFRLIAHYIGDEAAIKAYREDPDTDFHRWVAELCHCGRKAAKNVNFAMAYGAGKRKILKMLESNEDVMAEASALMEEMDVPEHHKNAKYRDLCRARAEEVYNTYHQRLPGLKKTLNEATNVCKRRGFIFNAFGRRRHLPSKAAFKAFNSLVQGCAMDYIKTRMVALAPRFNSRTRELGIHLVANVHDEILAVGPREVVEDPEVQKWWREELEHQEVKFSVPFTWDMGTDHKNWKRAANLDIKALEDAEEEAYEYDAVIAEAV